MREFLSKMLGKRVDVYCGGASSLRGKVLKVEGGVLHMKDEVKSFRRRFPFPPSSFILHLHPFE